MISRISPGKQATIPKKKANASLEHPLIRIPGAAIITVTSATRILLLPATRANRRNADSVLPLIRIPIAAPLTAISAKAIWNRQKA